jgi:hypothetical protein
MRMVLIFGVFGSWFRLIAMCDCELCCFLCMGVCRPLNNEAYNCRCNLNEEVHSQSF